MQKVSVVIATYNEEKNIASCLESVNGIADEIVLVDGGSTDNTVKLAKNYHAKITVTDNPPIFHINKQKAINLATNDWILQLDADELVSKDLINEIKLVIEDKNINGYWIPRKNWFLNKFLEKGGQYPDYTLRLYRKDKGYLPQKSVHEQAVVEGKTGYLKNALLHYPYKNFSVYIHKWNKYNLLLADQLRIELSAKQKYQKYLYFINYLIIKPTHWFLTTFLRHKGFMDGWPGFVFSFFSSLRFPISYIIYLSKSK